MSAPRQEREGARVVFEAWCDAATDGNAQRFMILHAEKLIEALERIRDLTPEQTGRGHLGACRGSMAAEVLR